MRRIFGSVLLCLVLVPICAQDKNSQTANNAAPGNNQQRGTKASPLVVQVVGAETAEQKAAEDKRRDDVDTAVKLREFHLTLAIAVAAGLQALAALVMIGIYRKQSKLMAQNLKATQDAAKGAQDSAEAAILNAETARNAERAWLKIGTDEERFKLVPENMAYFHWKITNTGKTPARIIGTQCVCQMVPRDEVRVLPKEPSYGGGPIHPVFSEMIPLNDFLLVPGEIITLYTPILGSGSGPLLWVQKWQDALDDDQVVIRAYGYIRYLDTFGEERRSSFCDFYQTHPNNPSLLPQFRPLFGVPSAYNEYT